jgi:hypothetical protein
MALIGMKLISHVIEIRPAVVDFQVTMQSDGQIDVCSRICLISMHFVH